MSRAVTARPESAATAPPPRSLPRGYLKQSQMPLAALVLLLPLIVLYEVGTHRFAFDQVRQTEQRIIAFNMMQDFFHWFGATGRYMPPLAVVGILLSCHIARNDPWKVQPGTLLGMAVEGSAWAIPLLAIGTLAARYVYQYLPLMGGHADWRSMFVLSIGAGIYEEMVFRLAGLTLLHLLLIDVLRLPRKFGYLAIVLITSLAFAHYHYWGGQIFSWRTFVFYTTAGVYFAVLFLTRGFAVTAFTHSVYDILVISLRAFGGL